MAEGSFDIYVQNGSAFSKKDWDDSALVTAYNKAMDRAKEKTNEKYTKMNAQESDTRKKKWKVGDYCEALFSADNFLYEAEILEVNEPEKKCIVLFLGYNNEEEVDLDSIHRSQGKDARARQIGNAKKELNGQWQVGDMCLALYSEDNWYYEAEILQIYEEDNCCLVRFSDYNNEEEVYTENIHSLPTDHSKQGTTKVKSRGKSLSSVDDSSSSFSSERSSVSASRRRHADASRSHSAPSPSHRRRHNNHRDENSYSPAEPLPPFMPMSNPVSLPFDADVSEDLGPMLMSWYMAGFHTGYYQGRSSRMLSSGYPIPPPHRGMIP